LDLDTATELNDQNTEYFKVEFVTEQNLLPDEVGFANDATEQTMLEDVETAFTTTLK
jgi:hypothetical protein